MAAMFVNFLHGAGHDVSAARFVLTNGDGAPVEGGTDDIMHERYISERGTLPP